MITIITDQAIDAAAADAMDDDYMVLTGPSPVGLACAAAQQRPDAAIVVHQHAEYITRKLEEAGIIVGDYNDFKKKPKKVVADETDIV